MKDYIERKQVFDAIIIGSSISGSTTAYILGKAGLNVALIDKKQFPRRKCCGEGISSIGVKYLKDLGLWSDNLISKTTPLKGYKIGFEDGKSSELINNKVQAVGISRYLLDSEICKKAISNRNVLSFNKRAISVLKSSDSWLVKLSNNEILISSNLIIANGGAAKSLFSNLNYQASNKERYGIAFWCEGEWLNSDQLSDSRTNVILEQVKEGEYLITPLDKNNINVSILLNKNSNSVDKSIIIERAKQIVNEKGFSISKVLETRGAPDIQSKKLKLKEQNIYFIGDALERFDPIGGMGMTHGLFSATVAAQSLIQVYNSEIDQKTAIKNFYKKREKGARVIRLLSSFSYKLNVSRNIFLKNLVIYMPNFCLFIMEIIKSFFPKVADLSFDDKKNSIKLISSKKNENTFLHSGI